MLEEAKLAFDIDMAASILVGDKESDIGAGINAGVGTNVLVRSGHAVTDKTTNARKVLDSLQELNGIF